MEYKATGIRFLRQPGGKYLSWSEGSGVTLLEEDGLFFKDLAEQGRLLPYEDWRLDSWERAKDLATVEHHREDVAFDLECYVDELGNRYDYGFGLNGF